MSSLRRSLTVAAAAAAVLGAAACGGTDGGEATVADTEPTCRQADDGRVEVVAADLTWDVDCLSAPAGEPLTIVVDNRDAGVNHNIHLPDAPGAPATDLEAGPSTQELDVSLDAGTYEYVCDIHPNMVGTLTVGQANRADH